MTLQSSIALNFIDLHGESSDRFLSYLPDYSMKTEHRQRARRRSPRKSQGVLFKWQARIVAEVRQLARTKKLQPAPASRFPQIADHLGIEDPAEDVRVRLKSFLEEVKKSEEEQPFSPPLAKPAMALLGLTPRTEHRGIGARQRRAAQFRYVAVSSMPRHEAAIAKELGLYLLSPDVFKDSDH